VDTGGGGGGGGGGGSVLPVPRRKMITPPRPTPTRGILYL